jgi:hypothetical protein
MCRWNDPARRGRDTAGRRRSACRCPDVTGTSWGVRGAGAWWLLVLGTAALALLGVVVAAVTGDPIPSLAAFAGYSGIGRIGLAGVVVVAFVANRIGEETGWRGFVADRLLRNLLRNHSLSRTSFLVAAVWVRRIGGAHLGLPEHRAERSARRGAAHGVQPRLGDGGARVRGRRGRRRGGDFRRRASCGPSRPARVRRAGDRDGTGMASVEGLRLWAPSPPVSAKFADAVPSACLGAALPMAARAASRSSSARW